MYVSRYGELVVEPQTEGIEGVGIQFKSGSVPWASSAAFAREAARELDCIVWCDPLPYYPDLDPLAPVVLEVDRSGERLFEVPDDIGW
ncbi:MAG TPA: hypothetical protein VD866_04275 [Urbifossiella sp.]|nr:hypothetical protein [Urbifossiella sp.]